MSAGNRLIVIFLITNMLISIPISFAFSSGHAKINNYPHIILSVSGPSTNSPNYDELKNLNNSLRDCLREKNFKGGENIVNNIERIIKSGAPGNAELAESYYYIGVFHQLKFNTDLAIHYLNLSVSLKEAIGESDDIYAKALYNLGASYSRLGIFEKHRAFTIRALEAEKNFYGPESHNLISTYASLITAYIELKNFNKALELTDIAYRVADLNSETGDPEHIAYLYNNIGVLYNSIDDYSRSKVFFEKAEAYYDKSGIDSGEGYNNLMYGMATSLKNLGLQKESEEYYDKGIKLAMRDYSLASYLILSNHANNLGASGKWREGKSVMTSMISRVGSREGKFSKSYYEVLSLYALYLGKYDIEKDTAIALYEKCINYFNKQGDSFLKFDVKVGYSLLLSERGENLKSLEVLQTLLYPSGSWKNGNGIFMNPDIDSLNADRDFMIVLKAKYQILKSYYRWPSLALVLLL